MTARISRRQLFRGIAGATGTALVVSAVATANPSPTLGPSLAWAAPREFSDGTYLYRAPTTIRLLGLPPAAGLALRVCALSPSDRPGFFVTAQTAFVGGGERTLNRLPPESAEASSPSATHRRWDSCYQISAADGRTDCEIVLDLASSGSAMKSPPAGGTVLRGTLVMELVSPDGRALRATSPWNGQPL